MRSRGMQGITVLAGVLGSTAVQVSGADRVFVYAPAPPEMHWLDAQPDRFPVLYSNSTCRIYAVGERR